MFQDGNGLLAVELTCMTGIFNPILQGEKFDKEGMYVKKWVPELKDVPKNSTSSEIKDTKILK